MAITTDVYDGLSVDGSIKVFPVASTILSDSHVRVHFTYPDVVGGSDVDHEVTANLWDVIDNSIVFREAPDESYTVKITVSTTGEGLEVSPSVASTVNENIENIITVAEIENEIDIVAEASYKAKVITVADNKVNVDTVASDITVINQTASDSVAINEIYNNRLEIYEADSNAAIATTKASEAYTSAAEALASKATTDANVVITNQDVVTTNSNVTTTNNDVVLTNANVVSTNTDVISTNEALASFRDEYISSQTQPINPSKGMLWFDETVGYMKVFDGSVFVLAGSSVNGTTNRVEYLATEGQITFNCYYDIGYIDVFRNGMKLHSSDFIANDGTTIILNTACLSGDIISIVAYGIFKLANHYTKAESDTTISSINDNISLKDDITSVDNKVVTINNTIASKETAMTNYVNSKPSGFKNYIINGGFDVWQRGESFTGVTSSNAFFADRWAIYKNGTEYNLNKYIEADGAISAQIATVDSTNQSYVDFRHKIEGISQFIGKTVTLSFEAIASNSDTLTIYLGRRYNTEGYQYQSVNVGSTTPGYTKYSHTFTLPTYVEDGSPDITLDASIDVIIRHNCSSTGAIRIKNVQLEEGSVATPFEQRPYGLELSLCQRYYETGYVRLDTFATDGANMGVQVDYKVKKRALPALALTNISSSSFDTAPKITNSQLSSFTAYHTASATSGGNFSDTFTADAEL